MISWRAPGRINLIGEHTDYNDGFALPLAIEQGCTATVDTSMTGEVRIVSAQRDAAVTTSLTQLTSGAVTGWAAYPVGVIWALADRGVLPADLGGLDVRLDSDVPDGAGLSSSAALICALAAAVNDLLELGLSRQDLVAVTHRTENDYVGAPTGGMDQMAALLCKRDHALLCDMRAWTAEPVPLPTASTRSAGPAVRRPRACSTSRRFATSPSPSSTPRSPACPTRCFAAVLGMSSPRTSGCCRPCACCAKGGCRRSARC